MPNVADRILGLAKPCSVLALALGLPLSGMAAPAEAQGLFDFLRAFSAPPAPAPNYRPSDYGQGFEEQAPVRRARPRPAAAAPVEQAVAKPPVQPRPKGEIDNPVPALFADSTLQPGDMVMFPDGLRVFMGRQGDKHSAADFQPLSRAGKIVSNATRKMVAQMRPAENVAWNSDSLRAGSKLAANTKDVDTTGSVKRIRASSR